MKTLLQIFLAISIFTITLPIEGSNNDAHPPSFNDIVTNLNLMEKILNKDIPSMEDFNSLYYGEADTEREIIPQGNYCENILALKRDGGPCIESLNKLADRLKLRPSFYLNNIKYLITDGDKSSIYLYISSDIKYCASTDDGFFRIDGIALVGNAKFKKVKFAFPCSKEEMRYWKIDFADIGGKSGHIFSITKPLGKNR